MTVLVIRWHIYSTYVVPYQVSCNMIPTNPRVYVISCHGHGNIIGRVDSWDVEDFTVKE